LFRRKSSNQILFRNIGQVFFSKYGIHHTGVNNEEYGYYAKGDLTNRGKGDVMKVQSFSKTILFVVVFIVIVMTVFVPITFSGQSSYGMPSGIDQTAKYFFFLHNYYVEKNGPDGVCKYYDILKAFADQGFVVISEIRTGKIIPCTYAAKVVKQVNKLLNAGVPPENITVGGHSKGGVISLCIASALGNSKVNFIIMAGCEIEAVEKYNMYPDFKNLKGRILSIYATSDAVANSCSEAFSMSDKGLNGTEIKLESDAGHKLFFTPQEIWLVPIVNWINDGEL
jgi:hypothetical protein